MPDTGLPFQQLQYRFAAHLRDPDNNPAPPGIEDRRMEIYRGLFYRNIESFIANGFPVLRSLYSDDDWHALVRGFYSRHISHSPQFYQIAEEFIRYLQAEHETSEHEPGFLLELAHYEWIEMILAINPADPGGLDVNSKGDLLEGCPVLNPCLHNLVYRYPVHRISKTFRPDEAGENPTHLVVYRKLDDEVSFLEVNAVTSRLLQRIEQQPALTGREQLIALASETGMAEDQVTTFGAQVLQDLYQKEVLLGVDK